MNQLKHLSILITAILLVLASCDKQEDIDRAYTDYRYDIVTYLGKNATGAVFEYLGHGDSASVMLQSHVALKDVVTNQRVLLRYDFADNNTASANRDIDVFGCNRIISDTVSLAELPPSELPRQQVKLRSMWRTGRYINLHCLVEYTGKDRTFRLEADPQTIDNDTVDCYLVHDLRGASAGWWRDCYASFDVAPLWDKQSFKCMRLHIVDITYPNREYYYFNKQ